MPFDRQRAFAREYLVRLGTVAAFLATALVAAAGILLIPTYVFLSSSASAKQARLDAIQSALSSSDETALSARLNALSADATTLLALQNAPSPSALMSAVLAVSRPGIAISSISYTAAASDVPGAIAIAGTALTRDALRGYQLALQSAPFAAAADLPVSAYAKDSNIPFTITITLVAAPKTL